MSLCMTLIIKRFLWLQYEFFNKMVEDFNLNFKNGEVAYIGWRPDISKIVINYWNYFGKRKAQEFFSLLFQEKKSRLARSYDTIGGVAGCFCNTAYISQNAIIAVIQCI